MQLSPYLGMYGNVLICKDIEHLATPINPNGNCWVFITHENQANYLGV